MPCAAAELSFGQLTRRSDDRGSDESVRAALQQAFLAVEKGFFEMIDESLAQRAMLLSEIPEVNRRLNSMHSRAQ